MLLLTSRDKPDEAIAETVDAFVPTTSLQTCSEKESLTHVKEVDIKGPSNCTTQVSSWYFAGVDSISTQILIYSILPLYLQCRQISLWII